MLLRREAPEYKYGNTTSTETKTNVTTASATISVIFMLENFKKP